MNQILHLIRVFALCSVFLANGFQAKTSPGKAYSITVSDGNKIPVIGLGTWGGEFKTSTVPGLIDSILQFVKRWTYQKFRVAMPEDKEGQKAIEVAIDYGYRHIDTAAFYGNEAEVGTAIQNKINDGTVRRKDLFITSKLWNDKHKTKDVVPALRTSLKNLKLDYVDLYLIHWPISMTNIIFFDNTDYVDTWKGMEKAKRLGLARSIGVSNFNESQLQRVLDSAVDKPVINQIEVNPNFTNKKLVDFCKAKDVQVTAYSPLGSMPRKALKNEFSPAPRLDDPVLTEIGQRYNKTTVQVVLRYLIDRDLIVIPKSVTPKRILQNIEVFDFHLTQEEIQKVDGFNINYRSLWGEAFRDSIYNPF